MLAVVLRRLQSTRLCSQRFSVANTSFMSKKMSTSTTTVAVICPEDSPALGAIDGKVPAGAKLIIANTLESFMSHEDFPNVNSLMFVAAGGDVALLPQLYDRCSNIEWVHSLFAGVDALAPFIASHLIRDHVPLTNGRGAFSNSLAEYAMAVALHFNKKITKIQANTAAKRWDKFVMPTLAGKTMGFLGFGHIGQTTARMAKALGMNIIALRKNPGNTDCIGLADMTYGLDDKLKVFQESDFVVSVLPGTPETLDFCGAAEFQSMKNDAIFISIGRGLVVDEDALAAAVQSGTIAGAALDVFKTEPLPSESKLWACGDDVLLTAHNADYTEEYFQLGWDVWRRNYDSFRDGKGFLTLVDKTLGY